jgi:hypothetical protein
MGAPFPGGGVKVEFDALVGDGGAVGVVEEEDDVVVVVDVEVARPPRLLLVATAAAATTDDDDDDDDGVVEAELVFGETAGPSMFSISTSISSSASLSAPDFVSVTILPVVLIGSSTILELLPRLRCGRPPRFVVGAGGGGADADADDDDVLVIANTFISSSITSSASSRLGSINIRMTARNATSKSSD